jgi:putative transposase
MRCNNKEFLFDEQSQRLFLALMRETCETFRTPLYNYCLMTNHVHLLFQVPEDDTLSRMMHRLANVFAKRFNAIRGRKGHLWEGRFVSTILEAPAFFLRCMAYIDLNPVRARIVDDPREYQWCAHRFVRAEDEANVTLHKVYLELGETPAARRAAYRRLLDREGARKPFSLAGTLLVGTPRFNRALRRRFGLSGSRSVRLREIDLGDGVLATALHKGGRPSK